MGGAELWGGALALGQAFVRDQNPLSLPVPSRTQSPTTSTLSLLLNPSPASPAFPTLLLLPLRPGYAGPDPSAVRVSRGRSTAVPRANSSLNILKASQAVPLTSPASVGDSHPVDLSARDGAA